MIDEYSFGSIVIDGRSYNQDVEVRWTGEVFKWQRKEGHVFEAKDIERAIEQNPGIIILGTGAYGLCQVRDSCRVLAERKGIKLIIAKTKEAVTIFNNILREEKKRGEKEKKVIGLFHLTC